MDEEKLIFMNKSNNFDNSRSERIGMKNLDLNNLLLHLGEKNNKERERIINFVSLEDHSLDLWKLTDSDVDKLRKKEKKD